MVVVLACGLERDWDAWERLPATEPGDDTTSTSSGSSGPDAPGSASAGSADASGASTTGAGTGSGSMTDAASDTGTQTSTGPVAVCGDGVVEGDEECDDPGQTACYKCVWDRLVFVTSRSDIPGSFDKGGGREHPEHLDYHCNHLAAVAGLITNNELRFKTWISTTKESAAERIAHSRGRYVLRNGLVFAESWDALVAGEILNPLNVDENSQTKNTRVWTDTRPDGSAMPGNHCEDWSSDSWETWVYWGFSIAVDGDWSLYVGDATNPTVCLDSAALYCFESP